MVYKKQYFINLTYHGKTYNSLNRFALDNHADFRQVYNNYHPLIYLTNQLISRKFKESDVKIYDYTTWNGI